MTSQNFLRVLVDPEEAQLDVVAVHGLNYTNRENHAEKTWTAPNGRMWLKDFLPKQLPDVRILLFGYNANVAFNTSVAGVDEQAANLLNRLWLSRRKTAIGRPIMFICYQLGGIIVKRALFDAQLDQTYASIRKSCYGLVFFATPHRGGRFETLNEFAGGSLKNTFIEALKEDSQFADGIAKAFRHQLESGLVISFYETLPMEYSGIVIVDRDSATLGLAGMREKQISLDADHQNLCIFGDCDGDDYVQVGGNIQELAESIKGLIKRRMKGKEVSNEVNTTDLDERKRQDVLDWLYPGAFDTKHIEISGRRKQNTGGWILEAPSFQKWVEKSLEYPLLWGHGIAGAGKTFISSFVIDHLQGQASNGVAYIYFDYNERGQQGPVDILRSLVKQLTSQLLKLPNEISDLYAKLRHESRTPTVGDMYTALVTISKSFTKTFIICDALDECEPKIQRKQLLQLFRKIETSKTGINLFLTSREHCEDIQCTFEDSAKIRLDANEKDIKAYIRQKIEEYPQAKRLFGQDNVESEVTTQLLGCTKGIFLLVHFYIEFLCQQTTLPEMLEELEKLKNTAADEKPLDTTYERAVASIRGQTKNRVNLALNILSWLVNAQRILTVDEIQIAVSVKQNKYELGELYLPDKKTLLDVCGSLVTLDENSNTIKLTHHTAQEYLLRNSILPQDSGFRLAMACCTYLSFDCFSRGSGFLWDTEPPFLDYAVNYFHLHIKGCDESLSKDFVLKFLERRENVSCYLNILLMGSRASPVRSDGYSYLCAGAGLSEYNVHWAAISGEINIITDMNVGSHLQLLILAACIIGHSLAVRSLLEGINPIYTTSGDNRVPILGFPRWSTGRSDDPDHSNHPVLSTLRLAVLLGHKKLVELLLEKGADISAVDQNGETALQNFLCREDNKEVLELLLEKGADISAVNEDGDTILHRAAYEGRKEVLELLLEKGANILAVNKHGDTILHQAAYEGREEVIDLLLSLGIDISAVNKNGDTVLHKAAYWGYKGVVEQLLRRGANIMAVNQYGDTVLHRAASEGHQGVVELLLKEGAKVSAVNKNRDTVLHEAAYGGHEGVIEILLRWGAETSVVNANEDTALHKATHEGHERVIDRLLQAGTKITVVNKNGDTILHEAAFRGYKGVSRLLLERGADISAVNKNGDTVLHRAAHEQRQGVINLLLGGSADPETEKKKADTEDAYNERKELIELLLEKGVDISVANKSGDTALHEFARRGYKQIVELLLGKGADTSVVNKNGDTVIHEAVRSGDERIFNLLLEKGADTSVVNKNGDTLLHEAVRSGDERIFNLLLEKGADTSVVNKNEDTLLHEAIRNGNERMVRPLLENGADTSAVNKNGDTILHEAVRNGNQRIVKLLMWSVNTSAVNNSGDTILHEATRHGHEGIVELLIWRIDTSVVNNNGDTMLHEAGRHGHEGIVKLLIREFDTSAVNTVLLEAAQHGHEGIVELLMRRIDTSIVNNSGDTILHEAVHRGYKKAIELLLNRGANISALDTDGRTALIVEVSKPEASKEVVQLLLDSGADTTAVDNLGHTALLIEVSKPQPSKGVIQLLLDRGADTTAVDTALCIEVSKPQPSKGVIQLPADRGTNTATVDTTLSIEVSKPQASEEVQLPADRGADTAAVDTTLRIEVSKPQASEEEIQLLLDRGTDTTPVDTALCIEVSKPQPSKGVIQLPADRGTDTTVVDNSRSTLLDPAHSKELPTESSGPIHPTLTLKLFLRRPIHTLKVVYPKYRFKVSRFIRKAHITKPTTDSKNETRARVV